jgi:2-polyprenyl-3-methyl-5-hydroxy-6-metoxy-1,4-benzoquinol methylase
MVMLKGSYLTSSLSCFSRAFRPHTHHHHLLQSYTPVKMSSADTSLSAEMQTVQAGWHDPSVAERYANAENATKVFAKLVVEKAQLLKDENIHVFDLATGTGVLVKEVYDIVPKERWGNVKVLGGDVSESMLGYLKARGEREGWTGLTTQVVDGNVSYHDKHAKDH